jgi:hypothetical protein
MKRNISGYLETRRLRVNPTAATKRENPARYEIATTAYQFDARDIFKASKLAVFFAACMLDVLLHACTLDS